MVQYLLHCTGCKHEFTAPTRPDVVAEALEHLRTVHQGVSFPSPGLDMIRVFEFATLDYPTRDHPLKGGIPSVALAPRPQPQPSVALAIPDPADLTF